MSRHYVLDENRRPIPADLMTWAKWTEDNFTNRKVGDDKFGDVRVSTVFLGLDHAHSTAGPPLIYETMIFGGPHDMDCWRYSTPEEAEAGHAEACKLVNS